MSALKLYSRILITLLVAFLIGLYLVLVFHKTGQISCQSALIAYLIMVPSLILSGRLFNRVENRKKNYYGHRG